VPQNPSTRCRVDEGLRCANTLEAVQVIIAAVKIAQSIVSPFGKGHDWVVVIPRLAGGSRSTTVPLSLRRRKTGSVITLNEALISGG